MVLFMAILRIFSEYELPYILPEKFKAFAFMKYVLYIV